MKGKDSARLRAILLCTASLSTAALPQAAAYAQDQSATDQTETVEDVIVVTGSLITNPNLERSAPVNVTTADEIELRGSNNAEALLREIPGITPSIGSAVNNGNAGSSFVNLRNLGNNRNVVLIDGNRVTPADLQGRFDLNNIPVALVERVDVLTGGASTTYGADAVSGVVNFITKRDFSGAEFNISNQITEEGDGNFFRADVTLGANFDDGRGNATFSIGYQEADPVFQGDRAVSLDTVDSYSGALSGSGTAVPTRITGTRPIDPATGLPSTNPAVANGGTRQVDTTTGAAITPFTTFNFSPFNIFQTPFERFNMFGTARYELSDAIEVYTRGLYSKNTVQSIIAPAGAFGLSVVIPLNNPFLPAATRAQLCAFNIANPVTQPGVYTPRFTPAECAAAANATGPSDPNYRTVAANVSRRSTELGPRSTEFVTQIFDYRLGFRGGLTDTIDWDVSGAYGESARTTTLSGYWLNSRVRQALLTQRDSAGNIVCQNPANGCVPLNIFGPDGSITEEMNDFLKAESKVETRASLAQVRAMISGDFGVAIPSAQEPISFALGGEYRRYQLSQQADAMSRSGDLGGAGGAAPDIFGEYDVYEAIAEFVVPVVQDKPFFESLTLEAGARYSDYKVVDGPAYDTWTYKLGGTWEPGGGVTLRGNYARAVRAPNMSELFFPQTVGLTNLATDPCQGSAPLTNANLRAVCIAQGAPAGSIGSIDAPSAGQANATFLGSLANKPEKSDSYTLGLVLQPAFVPNFSMSLDYYNIKIKDAITAPTPQDAILACFGENPTSPSATAASDPNCLQIRRDPLDGSLNGDSLTTPGLFLPTTNSGRIETDGIDLAMNWRGDVGFAELALSFNGNWALSNKFLSKPGGLNRDCVGYYSVNCASIQPEFQWTQRTTLSFSNVDVSLLWRYLHKVKFEPEQLAADIAAAEASNRNGVGGPLLPVAQQGCPDYEGADPNGCVVDPEFREVKAAHYFDLSTRFGITDDISVTFTVLNLFNKKPPMLGNTIGTTAFNSGNTYPSTYDALGRRYGVALRAKF